MPCDEKLSHVYIHTCRMSMDNAIEALLIDENNEKPSHSLTISLKSRGISLFGEETGWNSMCLLKGELTTTKLYVQEQKRRRIEWEREKEKEPENTKLKLVAWTISWNNVSRCTLLLTHICKI
jgi:hypothetical protein